MVPGVLGLHRLRFAESRRPTSLQAGVCSIRTTITASRGSSRGSESRPAGWGRTLVRSQAETGPASSACLRLGCRDGHRLPQVERSRGGGDGRPDGVDHRHPEGEPLEVEAPRPVSCRTGAGSRKEEPCLGVRPKTSISDPSQAGRFCRRPLPFVSLLQHRPRIYEVESIEGIGRELRLS
jgi:hypothetical protein